MEKGKTRDKIAIAALLHDIGKFWQRADMKWDESEVLVKYYKRHNESYDITVPLYDSGTPKYVHSLWTNAFFEKTRTGAKLKLNDENDRSLANLSANHHKPNDHLESIISIADRWSSGIDRPDEGEEGVSSYQEVKKEFGNDFVRKVPMHSIFDTIHKDYKEIKKDHTYPIRALELKEDIIFPTEREVEDLKADYKLLWNDFLKEYEKLLNKSEEFEAFYESLLTLLKKYTWCIPSATNSLPSNVSLFEHLKSTAAIALSLYDFCDEKNFEFKVNEHNKIKNLLEDDPLLMLCVDVSGIQKFIYDIANKKAAASLKGRSFYLEILIQNIISEILENDDIQAYRSNVIYSSGGKAYLILPNTKRVKIALEKIQQEIEQKLFKQTEGKLFVSLGYTSFNYFSFYGESDGKMLFHKELRTQEKEMIDIYGKAFNLSTLWRSVSDKAANRKNQKFKSILLDQYDELFLTGRGFDQNSKKCSVSGTRIEGKVCYLDGDDELPVSELVDQQVQIGKDLRTSSRITFDENAKYHTTSIGKKFSLRSKHSDEYARHISLNDWPEAGGIKGANGHMFYGGNYQPSVQNRSKTFEELCSINGELNSKMGILRMDVDNLGQVFIDGVKNKTFASYATLSMMLDLFFSGYLNTIQMSDPRFKEHIQILYSGGDDVFAVGRWDAIIDFAVAVRSSFADFVQRDDITISAGISIVNSKYPISKAAMDTGEAESRAKDHKNAKGEIVKNAIDVFGETIHWKDEWPEVESLKQQFLYFEKDTGRSILHHIQNYKLKKDDNQNPKKKEKDFSYLWQSGYQLTRHMERLKKKQEAHDFVKMLRDRIWHDEKFGPRFLDLAAMAARWTEYTIKFNQKNE